MAGIQKREVEIAKEAEIDDRSLGSTFLQDEPCGSKDAGRRRCGEYRQMLLQLVESQQQRTDRQYKQCATGGVEWFALHAAAIAGQLPRQQECQQRQWRP